ncbi:MAG TPA: hypothetical protein DHW82_13590 [Spirochaetia bacterium]|nr:hypothetical protein [Spirochaetia bacterium]
MKKSILLFILLFGLLSASLFAEEGNIGGNEEVIEVDIPDELNHTDGNSQLTQTDGAFPGSNQPVSEKTYDFKGKFTGWISGGVKENHSTYFNYDRLQLELTELYHEITFYVKANARYNTIYLNDADTDRRGENVRFDLAEAYVNYEKTFDTALSQFNLLIGQQVFKWGKADEVRPTDILSPQDLTLFALEDRNDRKLGRFALKTAIAFGSALRFEGIWMPIHRASESTQDEQSLFTQKSMIELQKNGFSVNSTQMPEKKLKESDIALKMYANLLGTDFSFSFYNGYDPLPFSKLLDPMGLKKLQPFLSRVTLWGLDFERVAFAGIVVRGEAAYFSKGMKFGVSPENFALYSAKGMDGVDGKRFLDATLGLDKNDFLIAKAYLNLQYSVNHIFDYEEGLKSRYGTKTEKTNHALIWNLSYEFGGLNYKIEFSGNYNFSQKDFMLKPAFHIKMGAETKIILGAYLFGGDEDTLLGQYSDKSFGYLKLEHLF